MRRRVPTVRARHASPDVERGFVRRNAAPDHGRVIRTELTAAGLAALARCDQAVAQVEQEMLADLDAPEVETLRATIVLCGRALDPDLATPYDATIRTFERSA